MLSSMLEAVLLDPNSKSVVGLVPKPAFREVILNVEPGGGIVIFDPEGMGTRLTEAASDSETLPRTPMLGYGGDGGGSNSPSRTFPTLTICNQILKEA